MFDQLVENYRLIVDPLQFVEGIENMRLRFSVGLRIFTRGGSDHVSLSTSTYCIVLVYHNQKSNGVINNLE